MEIEGLKRFTHAKAQSTLPGLESAEDKKKNIISVKRRKTGFTQSHKGHREKKKISHRFSQTNTDKKF